MTAGKNPLEVLYAEVTRRAVTEAEDMLDGLLEITRKSEVPDAAIEVVSVARGIVDSGMHQAQLAMLAAVAISRIINQEKLDQGVPQ